MGVVRAPGKDSMMRCERCLKKTDTSYRAYTEVLNMKVCADCAAQAKQLGIAIEFDRKRSRSAHRRAG